MSQRARRGANAIEFALTLPFFLMVMLGLMEYGYLYSMKAGLDNVTTLACREGAMMDPKVFPPDAVAESDFSTRSVLFCNGACTFDASDLASGNYAVPNRTLRCEATRSMGQITGFLPSALYPSSIRTISYYRLEWQRKN